MTQKFKLAEVMALQKWADDLHAEVMNCLDHYDHSEDCHLYRVPDDPDGELACDCWRRRLQILAQKYMVTPENGSDTNDK